MLGSRSGEIEREVGNEISMQYSASQISYYSKQQIISYILVD